jgi:hypothetical protein
MICVVLIVVSLGAGLLSGSVGFGGGVTGLVNGLLGISGPLCSAVFLTLELAPVSYIASEATTAAESVVR